MSNSAWRWEMTENLMDGLFRQMNRCRELIAVYGQIGPEGAFARAAIQHDITTAEKAIAGGDIAEMIRAYKALESCQ